MRDKLREFMSGRYGTDQLGRFTMGVGLASLILYMFFRISILYWITLICLIWYYWRALSRDHTKRSEENLRFLRFTDRIAGRFRTARREFSQRRDYRFYSCPNCHQRIRVPRGHGRISITCPRCRNEFIRKS